MASDGVQFFRQTDMKKEMARLIHNDDNLHERRKLPLSRASGEQKSTKRVKSPKKPSECKKSIKDANIEDVFLNSEYFKHQSHLSSLSFCSGDNGEHRWNVDSKFDVASQQKSSKPCSRSEALRIKNISNIQERVERVSSPTQNVDKFKDQIGHAKETIDEKSEILLDGFLSSKGRVDQDLITLITEQMFLAERELQITRTHLIDTINKLNERDLEILQLHEKLHNLQKSEKNPKKNDLETPTKTSEEYQRLVLASEKLKKQVKDMEEFLNDYGLVWVGDKESCLKPDFDKVIQNFQRLNSIASQPKIIQTTLGAKFELPREISVVLYSNGMLLRGNDFREYNTISTRLFLQDVEDGYFPSELQAEYPEGVPLEVIDKRNEIYKKTPEREFFKGRGNRLGSTFEGKPASMIFLEPMKGTKLHGSAITFNNSTSHKTSLKKFQKKRSRSACFQDEPKNHFENQLNPIADCEFTDVPMADVKDLGKSITLKIRFGKEKTESFVLNLRENEKLLKFQESLQQKLCERFHHECLVDAELKVARTDFELHIYGKPPIRLTDNLHVRLSECGITDNCVVNVTEI